jgi:hypothetical protein
LQNAARKARKRMGILFDRRPAFQQAFTLILTGYPKDQGSIEVVWTTGFSGLVMGLTINGEELKGKAKTHWDFRRKQQTADVVARKVECQAARTGPMSIRPVVILVPVHVFLAESISNRL